jgi:hypothetical protein
MAYVAGKSQIVMRRRFALLIALCATTGLALLLVSPAASADGLVPTSSATTNSAAPVEQLAETAASTAPVEHAEASAASAEAQPVETPEVTSAPDSALATVAPAASHVVASGTSNSPVAVSATPADAAGRTVRTIVDSVSSRTTSIAQTERGRQDTIVPAAQDHVQAVARSVARDSSEGIANVIRGTAATASPITDRPTTGTADSSPAPLLLNPLNPEAGAEALLPLSEGSSQAGSETPQDGTLGFPERQAGFFSPWSPIAMDWHPSKYPALSGARVEMTGSALKGADALGKTLPATAGETGARSGGTGPHGPVPLDVPSSPPGAIAPASGDSLFVPFAALLALLALAAPASMRRLREAPDFRAPNPFVCALERPG